MQAAKTAAEATENAAREAEDAANKGDALEATSKAAVAAWRASQVSPSEHLLPHPTLADWHPLPTMHIISKMKYNPEIHEKLPTDTSHT